MLTATRHDLLQLLLPVLVEHLICLIDDSVPSRSSAGQSDEQRPKITHLTRLIVRI